MAGMPYACAPTAKISLSANAIKTCLAISAPSNRIVKIDRVAFGFFGTSSTDSPVEVWLRLTDNGGTASVMTVANYMVTPRRRSADALQSTVRHTFTVEPSTVGGILFATAVHPQSNGDMFFYSADVGIEINGADTLPQIALRFLSVAPVSVLPTIWFSE